MERPGVSLPKHGVSFGEALRFWLKLGFVSFGGPAGQIAIMHRELVETRRWISERRFLHALNYCMVLPGPEAQQLATYIGWLMHGTWGGIAAGALFVLPVARDPHRALLGLPRASATRPLVAALLAGVKPAVVAIVIAAAVRIGSRALQHPFHVAIAVAAFVALAILAVPFPLVIAGAALAGLAGRRFAPRGCAPPAWCPAPRPAPAIIDDDTPRPAHARRLGRAGSRPRSRSASSCGSRPSPCSRRRSARANDFAAMARFFTEAALVTFGGAYAVLPYVVRERRRPVRLGHHGADDRRPRPRARPRPARSS